MLPVSNHDFLYIKVDSTSPHCPIGRDLNIYVPIKNKGRGSFDISIVKKIREYVSARTSLSYFKGFRFIIGDKTYDYWDNMIFYEGLLTALAKNINNKESPICLKGRYEDIGYRWENSFNIKWNSTNIELKAKEHLDSEKWWYIEKDLKAKWTGEKDTSSTALFQSDDNNRSIIFPIMRPENVKLCLSVNSKFFNYSYTYFQRPACPDYPQAEISIYPKPSQFIEDKNTKLTLKISSISPYLSKNTVSSEINFRWLDQETEACQYITQTIIWEISHNTDQIHLRSLEAKVDLEQILGKLKPHTDLHVSLCLSRLSYLCNFSKYPSNTWIEGYNFTNPSYSNCFPPKFDDSLAWEWTYINKGLIRSALSEMLSFGKYFSITPPSCEELNITRLNPKVKDDNHQMDNHPLLSKIKEQVKSLEETLTCPLSQEIINDPVIAEDNITYEKGPIENWLSTHHTSPLTREKIHNQTRPNLIIKKVLEEFSKLKETIESLDKDPC